MRLANWLKKLKKPRIHLAHSRPKPFKPNPNRAQEARRRKFKKWAQEHEAWVERQKLCGIKGPFGTDLR